jgi:hypothetical protein
VSDSIPSTVIPSTSAASPARVAGSINRVSPAARVPSATASAPRTGLTAPDMDSSPMNAQPSSAAISTCPLAASTEIASGRSKCGPSLRR